MRAGQPAGHLFVEKEASMLASFDSTDVALLYVFSAAALVVLWALVVFVIELRRVGRRPGEWHDDQPAPLVRRMRAVARERRRA